MAASDLPCPSPAEGSLAERAAIVEACVIDVRGDDSVDARVRGELDPERRAYAEAFIARAETVLGQKFPHAEVAVASVSVSSYGGRNHFSVNTDGTLTIDGVELTFRSLGLRRNPAKNTSMSRVGSAHGPIGGHAEVILGRSPVFRDSRGADIEYVLALTHQAMAVKDDVVTPPLTPTIQQAYRSLAEYRGASALFADVIDDSERSKLEGARRMVIGGFSSIFGDAAVTVEGGSSTGSWHGCQLDLTVDGVPMQAISIDTYLGGFNSDNVDRAWQTELTLVVPGATEGSSIEIGRGRKGAFVARHTNGELPLLVWKAANELATAEREAAVLGEASAELGADVVGEGSDSPAGSTTRSTIEITGPTDSSG